MQVIKAIAYAHGRLVVHRDLKPSNVLVTPDGQVHLLDFGIAKLLLDTAPGESGLTQEQGRVLTLHYASPEQVAGEAITVQSDVYSLGVLLYELLTGVLPITPKRRTLGAVEDAILLGDAALASSRVKERAVAKALRGDVDAILAKAMRREPAKRYSTADSMARDIERHLNGETVSARPDGQLYHLQRAVRRNWIGVSAAAAVVLAVLFGSATAVVQSQRVAKAMQREQVVKQFVAEVLRANVQPLGPGPSLRSAPAEVFLERSAKLVQSRFAGQPELQAELYAMVGAAFADMGASQLATEYGLRQVEALSLAGAASRDQARALLQLSKALLDQRRFADAEQRARRAAALAEGEPDLVLRSQVVAARSLAARDLLERLDTELAQIDAGVTRVGHAAGASAAWALGLRAKLMLARNQRAQALKVLDSAIDRALVAEGPDSAAAIELRLQTASALAGFSSVEQQNRYFDAAIAALERRGTEQVIRAAYELARFAAYRYRATSQISARQALATISEARTRLANTGRVLPAELSAGLDVFEGDVLAFSGRIAAGIVLIERAFPALYTMAPGPSERRQLAGALGRALTYGGRHELADYWHRETLLAQIEAGRGRHPAAANDYVQVAANLSMWGHYDEAIAFIDTAPDFAPKPEPTSKLPDLYNQRIKLMRSSILLDSGNPHEALRGFPRGLLEALEPVDRQQSLEVYGQALCEAGQVAQGLVALREAMRLYEAADDDENAPWTARLRSQIGRCVFRQGDRQSAASLAAQARAAFLAQPEVSPYFKAPLTSLERQLGLKLPPV